ncbi:MAG: TIGR03067 domain-containing protein [Planctomycetota bacterium]|nr:TIGR03067 domain-containing protein [Planctomycetota bacterium]
MKRLTEGTGRRAPILIALAGFVAAGLTLVPVVRAENNMHPLQGTWKVISLTNKKGEKVPGPAGTKITFDRDKMTNEGQEKKAASIKWDTTKTPYEIDVTPADSPDGQPHTMPGIFKVEGDKLSLCLAAMEVASTPKEIDPQTDKPKEPNVKATYIVKIGKRPTGFDDGTGDLMILERVKQ